MSKLPYFFNDTDKFLQTLKLKLLRAEKSVFKEDEASKQKEHGGCPSCGV